MAAISVKRPCNGHESKTRRHLREGFNHRAGHRGQTELREYVQSRGWTYEVYRDRAQRSQSDRPELTACWPTCGRVDIVVVGARTGWLVRRHLLEIAEQCESLGVDLVSLRQNIDTTMPAGRLTFQILGAVAEFEREMLRERVRAGMAQARRTGKRMGRPALRCFTTSDVDRLRELR